MPKLTQENKENLNSHVVQKILSYYLKLFRQRKNLEPNRLIGEFWQSSQKQTLPDSQRFFQNKETPPEARTSHHTGSHTVCARVEPTGQVTRKGSSSELPRDWQGAGAARGRASQ